MDSTFLGALLILQRAAGRGQCPLTLVSPSPTCCRLLQQMGLHGQLPVVTAEEDPTGPCTTLTGDAEDVPALRCNVVQAHQELAALVREEMTGAMKLDVPLKVDVSAGKNWLEVGEVAA